MTYNPDSVPGFNRVTPCGGGPSQTDIARMSNSRKRGPIVHWLDSKGWYSGLVWGVNPMSAFVNRLKPWINNPANPDLQDGDVIIGLDDNDQQVVLNVNQIGTRRAPGKHEQQKAP